MLYWLAPTSGGSPTSYIIEAGFRFGATDLANTDRQSAATTFSASNVGAGTAEQDPKNYDALNYRDDQFDLSDALIAIAISLLAITALTHKRWLFWLALLPTAGGILMGLAGLLGWHLHPDVLSRLLS